MNVSVPDIYIAAEFYCLMKKTLLLTVCLVWSIISAVYSRPLIDSLTKKRLFTALNAFLVAKEGPNKENKFVLKQDLLSMSALIDEMKGMDKNVKLKDNNYYRSYLTNIVDLNKNSFLVQVSYIGINDKAAVLRASFRLIARKQDTSFYFSAPLEQNTLAWKAKKIGNINFHFKDTLDLNEAKAYLKFVDFCDKKLDVKPEPIEYYECDNFPETLQILGVDYKSDYNGIKYDDITSHENNATLEISGGYTAAQRFDRHDLWHDRLHMVMPVDSINRPVDEGCAYLYGGSWGKTWPEVLALFKKYVADHPDADWLKLYGESTNFYTEGQKTFKVDYILNALIVQKIDREKGFAPVKALLSCGKREPGDENYFKVLEKVCGITKANFNDSIRGLIKQN